MSSTSFDLVARAARALQKRRTPALELLALSMIIPASALAQSGGYPVAEATGGAGAWIVVPDSVPRSDCSSDPMAWTPADGALNAWLKSKADGSQIRFPKNACYGYNKTIELVDRNNLTIDGNGSTFRAVTLNSPGRIGVQITGGANIVLKNMTVYGFDRDGGHASTYHLDPDGDGVEQSYEWQHAYKIKGTKKILLENVKGFQTFGDAVSIAHDSRGMSGCLQKPEEQCLLEFAAEDVIVRDSDFGGATRQGISIVFADGVRIEDTTLTDVARAGIDIEPSGLNNIVRNINLVGNTLSDIWFSPIVFNGPATIGMAENLYIAENTVLPLRQDHSSCQPPVNIDPNMAKGNSRFENVTIQNNVFNSFGVAVDLKAVDNVIIKGNVALGDDHCFYRDLHPVVRANHVLGLKMFGNQLSGFETGLLNNGDVQNIEAKDNQFD